MTTYLKTNLIALCLHKKTCGCRHDTVPLIMQVWGLLRWLWSSSWTSTTVSSLPGPSSTWLPPSPPCLTCPGTPAVSKSMSKSIEEGCRTGHGRVRPALEHLQLAEHVKECQRVSKRGTGQVTVLPDLPWNTCGKQSMSKSIEEEYRTGHGPARPALEHLR